LVQRQSLLALNSALSPWRFYRRLSPLRIRSPAWNLRTTLQYPYESLIAIGRSIQITALLLYPVPFHPRIDKVCDENSSYV
jgi:hypothetical protein